MINYLVAGIAVPISFFLFLLLVTQFWRLGQYLKSFHPILFRLYASVWILSCLSISLFVAGLNAESIHSANEQADLDTLVKSAPNINDYDDLTTYEKAMIKYGMQVEKNRH